MQNERQVYQGFIAGIIAGLVLNTINFISYYLFHFAKLRYLDFAAIIIYGRKPVNTFEAVFAQLGQLAFTGFLGIVFAYLITKLLNSKNYLLKGGFSEFYHGSLFMLSLFYIKFPVF